MTISLYSARLRCSVPVHNRSDSIAELDRGGMGDHCCMGTRWMKTLYFSELSCEKAKAIIFSFEGSSFCYSHAWMVDRKISRT